MITIESRAVIPPGLLEAGLSLRNWRDDRDYDEMRRVMFADKHSQGIEEARSLADFRAHLESLPGMDVHSGIFLLEHDGSVIACKMLRGFAERNGTYCYGHQGYVLPEWKRRGIGLAMIRHSEEVLRALSAQHPPAAPKFFQVFLQDRQTDLKYLLQSEGYRPVRYFYEMVRPDLENISSRELPRGIEARPVLPEHMRQIWDTLLDGFQDHWGETEYSDADYEKWLKRPEIQPGLWHVAWEGDRIVGGVLNTIDDAENTAYSRKRGFTDDIFTAKEYRGRGIAQALIARGLAQFQQLGCTEAALDVDAGNATGALRLYEKLGYRPHNTVIANRKPL